MLLTLYFDDFHVALKKCIFKTIFLSKLKMLGLYLYTLIIGKQILQYVKYTIK